jgi:hypothetical protein
MVDLLVLTSIDQLLFTLKISFTLFKQQATLIRRSTVLCLPPQLVFPDVKLAKILIIICRMLQLQRNMFNNINSCCENAKRFSFANYF